MKPTDDSSAREGHVSRELRDRLNSVLAGCVEHLGLVYSTEQALFPYSSRLVAGAFINDYRKPDALRYTLNTLLGLQEAAQTRPADLPASRVEAMIESFCERHGDAIEDPADLGMLLLLLTSGSAGQTHEALAGRTLETLRATLRRNEPGLFNMQGLSWIIWGAAQATRAGIPSADEVGRAAAALLKANFVDRRSGLPRHSTRPYRRNLVSFGSLTYFLRAMHEAGAAFGDEEAQSLYERGVRRTLSIQGPQGEWPWMIHVPSGNPVDVYPVFSVHQDSMAMLFLLPALDAGIAGVSEAIERSVSWCFGENELSAEFYRYKPFSASRSIERAEGERRLFRYLRFLSYSVTRRPGRFHSARCRVNEECRSYHLGWLLFAWSHRLHEREA
jgi:hypothetical protein